MYTEVETSVLLTSTSQGLNNATRDVDMRLIPVLVEDMRNVPSYLSKFHNVQGTLAPIRVGVQGDKTIAVWGHQRPCNNVAAQRMNANQMGASRARFGSRAKSIHR